ncbi:MAG: DUF418 domain-containing protein [Planctomycetota bacterium]
MTDTPTLTDTNKPGPNRPAARLIGPDVLRGFALLGILVPNIFTFAWPFTAMTDASAIGDALRFLDLDAIENVAANSFSHQFMSIAFLGKFMFIFAMLFGAGVVMFDNGKPGNNTGRWYLRLAWLLLFGVIHAIFIWYGDILVWYAAAGMLLPWWCRKLEPIPLLLIASLLYLIGMALSVGLIGLSSVFVDVGLMTVEEAFGDVEREVAAMTGTFLDGTIYRAITASITWFFVLPLTFIWSISGLMLAGIALAKLGIITGERSPKFYSRMAIVGITLGIITTLAGYLALHDLTPVWAGQLWAFVAQLFGIPLGLGYIAAVLWLVTSGKLAPVTTGLAAVGRMAFTNYLGTSIICSLIFTGPGLGLYATVQFPTLWLIVIGVWTVNIAFSLFWLRGFRFGPLEWLWRCLTYGKLLPIRR